MRLQTQWAMANSLQRRYGVYNIQNGDLLRRTGEGVTAARSRL
jgi:hypothetical protein